MPDGLTVDVMPVEKIPAPPAALLPQGPQYSATETYSKHILGSSSFHMYYLYAKGWGEPFPILGKLDLTCLELRALPTL
ncbi:MAG: hypothetical protein B0A82_18725 [Alkalinema sp. CACIAM 70d]|nr:MAG: hypothetical protein B0A82_18725 [Alkalinema sp. CACIAM 70d]